MNHRRRTTAWGAARTLIGVTALLGGTPAASARVRNVVWPALTPLDGCLELGHRRLGHPRQPGQQLLEHCRGRVARLVTGSVTCGYRGCATALIAYAYPMLLSAAAGRNPKWQPTLIKTLDAAGLTNRARRIGGSMMRFRPCGAI